MAKVAPPIFGILNPGLYTNGPVGNSVSGIKSIRSRAKATIKASGNSFKVGASHYPNGKKVKVIKP